MRAEAHWVTRDTILWQAVHTPLAIYQLHTDPAARLSSGPSGVQGGSSLNLTYTGMAVDPAILDRFPHLANYGVLKLAPADLHQVPALLKSQNWVSAAHGDGRMVAVTGLQIPGVLDDLFTYRGALGVRYEGGVPVLRVWAPTAQAVALCLFDNSHSQAATTVPMMSDPLTGVWSVVGQAGWTGKFYLFQVDVYAPGTDRVERNLVTDPYATSLSTNSRRGQIVDLSGPEHMPPGWSELCKPALAAPEDSVLYELHVRDFSVGDMTVPGPLRGTYMAFTVAESDGMRHLRALAEAGLTHVHLLPVFDIATIDEDKTAWIEPDQELLRSLPPDSDQQQALIATIRDRDAFNWGYDPYHYTAPEGSYATDPDGPARIREFRAMVKALGDVGLRVVMDVVYNHTHASGQHDHSVLDRIVPGYYHRLNAQGSVETSTCCQNTATEHAMMEKLMVDSLVTWATAYKVDGFRFDLMGHHMVANMVNVRDTLHALTLERDGVDGKTILLYGEGWDFGEVANGARGRNATQRNLAGTGIGTFSDRLRDAVRGGGPFRGLREQGFATGLWYAPNEYAQESPWHQRAMLLRGADLVRLGLAGNLREYRLTDADGRSVAGHEIIYNGQPAGYARDPREVVNYVEAHDNETFWDAIQLKAPASATLTQRVRMHNLGLSLVALGQGIPFFQAGQDMLRSKSLDRNSFNSGDWFNRLDWTYQTNNWGIGLPPEENRPSWPAMRPLLADSRLRPGTPEILAAVRHFRELLRIRRSSPLFRLRSGEEIGARLHFLNTGPEQLPGLIVMTLSDVAPPYLDPVFARIVVFVNATFGSRTWIDGSFAGSSFELHPVQATSADPEVRTAHFDVAVGAFTVPAQSAVVFVQRRDGLDRQPLAAVNGRAAPLPR